MYLSIGQAAKMIGVSVSSLRRWERNGKIVPDFRTPGGHKRYSIAQLKQNFGIIKNDIKKHVVGYARVSSHDQVDDLERQKKGSNSFLAFKLPRQS